MKKLSINISHFIILIIFVLVIQSCEKGDNEEYNKDIKLTIYPEYPTAQDEIKIIEEICTYELLKPVIIKEDTIEYKRYFNSSMGMPCLLTMDTVSLGQLEEGHYTITYSMIDISHQISDSIIEADTMHFYVVTQ